MRLRFLLILVVGTLIAVGVRLGIHPDSVNESPLVGRNETNGADTNSQLSASEPADQDRRSSSVATTLRVLDRHSSAGIHGAEVTVGDATLLTDGDGRFAVPDGLAEGDLHVSHEQYEKATAALRVVLEAGEIRLSRKNRLVGRVIPPVGPSANVTGVTVVAWKGSRNLSASDLQSGQLAEGILETICDEAGRFSFDELPEDASVRLLAGGRGLMSQVLAPVESPRRGPPVIQLSWLHGAVIRFVDQGGEPVCPSIRLSPPSNWSVHLRRDFGMRRVPLSHPALALNGILREGELDTNPEQSQVFVSSSQRLDSLGGVEVSASIPGYEDHSQWVALRVPTDGLDTTDIALTRVAEGFGDLEVRAGPRLRSMLTSATPSVMTISLVRKGSPSIYYVASSDEAEAVIRLGRVPFGSYKGYLEVKDGTRLKLRGVNSSESLLISSDVASVTVEAAHCSRLVVKIVDSGGQDYQGPARFSFGRITSRGLRRDRDYAFAAPPYSFDLLEPARYGGALLLPQVVDLQLDGEFEFQLPDGSEEVMVIRLN